MITTEIVIQIKWLFILAIPVAAISWTVTHEEIFKEPRDFCIRCSTEKKSLLARKFFYLFTCEYCFSHYVSIAAILFSGFKLLLLDWRGYIIAGFALVWIANIYMSLFLIIRSIIKKLKLETDLAEQERDKENAQ